MKASLLVILICFTAMPSWAADAKVDSLYRSALARMNVIEPKKSVDEFKRVLKKDGKYAPALAQLTRLYIRINTVEYRRRAVEVSGKAMRIEPENLHYQLLHGEALWNRGFQRKYRGFQRKYTIPHQIVAFREGKQIRMEMAYAIPTSKLKPNNQDVLVIDDGLFLFDLSWRDVYRKARPLGLKRQEGVSVPEYLLQQRAMALPQGTYNIVVEVGDRVSGSVGTFRAERFFNISDTELDISDLLLAQNIEMLSEFPEKRSDLKIVPNPLRFYKPDESAFVYLEVYNLAKDEFGRTQYEITYSIGVPEKEEVDPSMFGAVALKNAGGLLIVPTAEELALDLGEEGFSSDVLSAADQTDGLDGDAEGAFDPEAESGDAMTGGEEALLAKTVDFEVQYVIDERNQVAESLEELRKACRQSGTSISSTYRGDKPDDFTFLEIDLSKMPRGIYKLDVAITDLKAKKMVRRNAIFQVRNQ